MVTMATKTNGSHGSLYEKWMFFQLKIRKLTIRTINFYLMEDICIYQVFYVSLGTVVDLHEN